MSNQSTQNENTLSQT